MRKKAEPAVPLPRDRIRVRVKKGEEQTLTCSLGPARAGKSFGMGAVRPVLGVGAFGGRLTPLRMTCVLWMPAPAGLTKNWLGSGRAFRRAECGRF